jgi:hypothetical protein
MFLIDENVLAKDIVLMVVEKLGISDGNEDEVCPYFSLFESVDGKKIGRTLDSEEVVTEVVHGWENPDMSKLLFILRLNVARTMGVEMKDRVAVRLQKPAQFVSKDVYLEAAEVSDEALLQTQYIQAIYNVLVGMLNVVYEDALKLAGYQFFVKFREYKPSVHKVGFLGPKIVELIPLKYLKQKGFEKCETDLFEYIKDTTQYEYLESQAVAQRKYLDVVWRLGNYGRTLFRVTSESFKDTVHENLLLGIHSMGVELYDRTSARKLLASWSLGEIMTWGFDEEEHEFFMTLPPSVWEEPNSITLKAAAGKVTFSTADDVNGRGRTESDANSNSPRRVSMFGGIGRHASAAFSGGDSSSSSSTRSRSSSSAAGAGTGTAPKDIAHLLTDYALAFQREQAAALKRIAGDAIDYNSGVTARSSSVRDTNNSSVFFAAGSSAVANARPTPRQELAAMKKANDERKDLGKDEETRKFNAVVRLQAYIRGFMLRNEWYKEDCAILIQSVWRGYQARALVSDMIEIMLFEDSEGVGGVQGGDNSSLSSSSSSSGSDSD